MATSVASALKTGYIALFGSLVFDPAGLEFKANKYANFIGGAILAFWQSTVASGSLSGTVTNTATAAVSPYAKPITLTTTFNNTAALQTLKNILVQWTKDSETLKTATAATYANAEATLIQTAFLSVWNTGIIGYTTSLATFTNSKLTFAVPSSIQATIAAGLTEIYSDISPNSTVEVKAESISNLIDGAFSNALPVAGAIAIGNIIDENFPPPTFVIAGSGSVTVQ